MSLVQIHPLDLTTSPGCSSLSFRSLPSLLSSSLSLLVFPQEGTTCGCAGVFITHRQHLALKCLFLINQFIMTIS